MGIPLDEVLGQPSCNSALPLNYFIPLSQTWNHRVSCTESNLAVCGAELDVSYACRGIKFSHFFTDPRRDGLSSRILLSS